jgi:NAD(P)-dependent dehydrogenase (short-subunit alcohol dehydrogenase family)
MTSTWPPQHQDRKPGIEAQMQPPPEADNPNYRGSNKLLDRVALITGGDSGIGRAVAIAFAKEGADVAIAYYDEREDAEATRTQVEAIGRRCIALSGDIGDESVCQQLVARTVEEFGRLDILVNNAGEHYVTDNIEDLSAEQLETTFRTNVFSMFYLCKAAVPHLKRGSTIINTTSVIAYKGNDRLMDYAATKGAMVTFTRSLAQNLLDKGIRVNAVAPGPIWTPLVPATYDAQEVASFGEQAPMGRAGQPYEMAPSYVFLASQDSSYMSGQVLHPNGGYIINA